VEGKGGEVGWEEEEEGGQQTEQAKQIFICILQSCTLQQQLHICIFKSGGSFITTKSTLVETKLARIILPCPLCGNPNIKQTEKA